MSEAFEKFKRELERRNPMSDKPPVDPRKMRYLEGMGHGLFEHLDQFTDGQLSSRKVGMALFLFSFTGAELTYISNANREDMVKMLLEFIAKNPPAMKWDEQHG